MRPLGRQTDNTCYHRARKESYDKRSMWFHKADDMNIGDTINVPFGFHYEQINEHLWLPTRAKTKRMEVLAVHKNGGLWTQDPEGGGYSLFSPKANMFLSRHSNEMY